MKLSAPSKLCFIISVVVLVLGLVGKFAGVAFLAPYVAILLIVAWVVLALGCLMTGF